MKKKHSFLILFACSLVLAILAHLFFLKEWTQDRYMVGPNDGLQQMVTFKKLLYEQYTTGNFFYSYQYGLGGGTYSQLAFYFSTAFVFIITTAVVFLLESLHLIGTPDIIFWAQAAVIISVCRLTMIILMTTLVFRYMKSDWLPAFAGASVYGLSVIYFRHVTYWEFFADAMLWVPLLVLGVEKIIREERSGLFIVAVAITLFNNFYFAYINLIFIGIYIGFRWMIRLQTNEISRWNQLKLYAGSGLIGFGISAVAFIPAVYGYFHNHRPPYPFSIKIVDFPYNILFTSPYVLVPAIFLLFLFTFSLYKFPIFRLFALISAIFILLHFSPLVASAFNGFSAPQYRWEYLISFMMGGAVSAGLQHINKISTRKVAVASILVITTYLVVSFSDHSLDRHTVPVLGTILLMLVTITLTFVFIWKQKKVWYLLLCTGVLLTNVVFANGTQYVISKIAGVDQVSKSYLLSEQYNGEEQRTLLQKVKKQESDPFYRIDWKVRSLNNTPIVQNFNGMSAYSSILNQNLLYLYLYDLHIDMGRESVSRFATLGNRANLYSLFQGKYMMREKDNTATIPYGFKKVLESEDYAIYQNTNILPFVRTTNQVFSEKDMENAPVLTREQAMLEGVIVADIQPTNTELPEVANIINQTTIETAGATFEDNKLAVTDETGGLDLVINQPKTDTKDYYVSFHIESLAKSDGFAVKVNDYRTTRKHNQSIYKTYVDDLTIRVKKADKIKIRVPKGNYILKDLALFRENYQALEMAKKEAYRTDRIRWDGNKLMITYNNQSNNRYMMLPIPFEKGWEVKINNVQQPLEKVNYSFLGFPIMKGINHIELVYYPPFFKISLILTIVSILLGVLFVRNKRPRQINKNIN
ncbi:YfhO family protein [Halobacillus shinanisalinarum]|uniref:YfhO family protein n=1 Tax=Halobacillus shinanisalinarum TaxID=2932258 RepID=A0ABY4H151_9BACI|nr:YfhO family protein [Halobacillus shinanisalinarum]UOQ93635.1 YfhO family protein [Halobacillus shinanisalinarum]